MAQAVDAKLRLTASLLGTVTCKDLAAAFRRVNPATSFDVERAHKWLQGRARPRELQLYEDWAKLLDVGQPGRWVADADLDEFIETICDRHDCDRKTLQYRSGRHNSVGGPTRQAHALVGTYACYSHAWSPYYRKRLIRGGLSITAGGGAKLFATYSEILPTGRMCVEGPVLSDTRMLHLDLREADGDAHFAFFLFSPTRPAMVLGGLMCGVTVMGPEAQPSVTRIVMVRLPASSPHLDTSGAYLPPAASVAQDLTALGMRFENAAEVDQRLDAFLTGDGSGIDQIPVSHYSSLVETFDMAWLACPSATEA